jgi:tRNA A-37 threonylcarbamoyl transferase component Bud32
MTEKADSQITKAVLEEKVGAWRFTWKNDGFDYQALLNRFLSGEIPSQRLTTGSAYRMVYKVEYAGRTFVLKKDTETDPRLEKKLWFRLAGTLYSRLIRLTAKAIKKGCPVLQDVFLVAEKMDGHSCQEAYVIAEYVPGQSFINEVYEEGKPIIFLRPGSNINLIAQALSTLHDYGLASNDAIISNFILTKDNKIKIIDLTTNTPVLIAQANDIIKMRRSYKTDVPTKSLFVKIITALLSWQLKLKHLLRVWRKKEPAKVPPKIWEDLPPSAKNDPDSPPK